MLSRRSQSETGSARHEKCQNDVAKALPPCFGNTRDVAELNWFESDLSRQQSDLVTAMDCARVMSAPTMASSRPRTAHESCLRRQRLPHGKPVSPRLQSDLVTATGCPSVMSAPTLSWSYGKAISSRQQSDLLTATECTRVMSARTTASSRPRTAHESCLHRQRCQP